MNGRGQRLVHYGHTFGHVVENLTGYGTGRMATAIGMVAVGELAATGSLEPRPAKRQRRLIQTCGLPPVWPPLDPSAVLATLQGDKKVQAGTVRFVVPDAIGAVSIRSDVNTDEVKACLAALS